MSHEESENDVSRVRHARMYFFFDKFQINRQKEEDIIPSMIKSARKYTGRMIKKKEKFLISVDCWWVSYPFFPIFFTSNSSLSNELFSILNPHFYELLPLSKRTSNKYLLRKMRITKLFFLSLYLSLTLS